MSEFKQSYEDKNLKYKLKFKGSKKEGKILKDIMREVEEHDEDIKNE